MRGKKTKERIDTEAMRLFVEKGVDATSIRDISSAADIAEGTIYRHYTSKDEMVWQLFYQNYCRIYNEINSAQSSQDTLRDKLGAMIKYICELFDNDRVMFIYLLVLQHGQAQKLTSKAPSIPTLLSKLITEAIKRKEIPAQKANLSAAFVMGIVLQTVNFLTIEQLQGKMAKYQQDISQTAWKILIK